MERLEIVIFFPALWHGPAPNNSGNGRKTLLYNYCQMFMRCYDFEKIPDTAERATPDKDGYWVT